jgi:AcrR family transcriptional regulator
MGTLRHYFSTQAELLSFALEEIERDLRERFARIDQTGGPRAVAARVLRELVPMDEDSRLAHQIWLAFVGRALVDPALREHSDRVYDDLRALCAQLVAGVARPGLDADLETERMYALLDGLAMHAVLRPERWTPARLGAVLDRHLAALASANT